MRIAVASGKGGTGKTTIATSLALAISRSGHAVQLIDCDVEEPNAYIYLKPVIADSRRVSVMIPVVDESKCTHCGACQDFCKFNSIAVFPDKVLFFPEMCHSCNGCIMSCPEGALSKGKRGLGTIEIGDASGIVYGQGRIEVGEARATPVISALSNAVSDDGDVVMDAPPGTSCPFVETVGGSDVVVLVTEPTPFGLYDLMMAVEALEVLGKPFGVVINKDGMGDDRVDRYLEKVGIPIWLRIPHDREIAKCLSNGTALIDVRPELGEALIELYRNILESLDERRG